MSSGFKKTSLLKYQINPKLYENQKLAFIIDDYTLSHKLRTPCKTLWWALVHRTKLYNVFLIPKETGGTREIRAPHPYLKRLQYRLYIKILHPLHVEMGQHVTAYRKGIGTKAAVMRHIYKCDVCDSTPPGESAKSHPCPRMGTFIKMDLKDFFHSTRKWWIEDYLMSVGYSQYVSDLMAVLMTVPGLPNPKNSTLKVTGVPQGSPTSGAICNLVAAQRLDTKIIDWLDRLNNVYKLEGEWQWRYTRYADDLAITCGKNVPPYAVSATIYSIKRIIRETGYIVNDKKTKVKKRKQRKRLLGLVFNQKPNIQRKDYLALRAITHNCLNHGFESQAIRAGYDNPGAFYSWVNGKVNYVKHIHPAHGEKLSAVLNKAVELHKPNWKD
jgi:RNA-directed DNA polymerase